MAPSGSAYSPPSDTIPAPASCTRFPKTVTRRSREPNTERSVNDVSTCSIASGYSVQAWPPTTRHAGLGRVADQAAPPPEHPAPLGQQFLGLLIAAAGEPQQIGDACRGA